MEDLEQVETVAPELSDTPTTSDQDTETLDTSEEQDLSDEELQAEISRLKEEAKSEENPKDKRHLEQEYGWKMKVLKERERAKTLEEKNNQTVERLNSYESNLLEELYERTNTEWLPYFENLYKTNPDMANKLAKDKYDQPNAKTLILETKRSLASEWDEEASKIVSEEDIRQAERDKVYHELAIEQVETIFNELSGQELTDAKSYFDDIVEWKKLTPTTAKKYADMSVFYATRNRTPGKAPVDKDRVIASMSNTWISNKSWVEKQEQIDIKWIRQQLLNSWITEHQVNLMYPL